MPGVVKTRARENTRREMAAYVAEGTIKPDEAIALLNSGLPKWEVQGLENVMGKNG